MSGRHAPRSKNGCQTCRQRKVKCDENRPICNRCSRLNLGCVWGFPGKHGGSKSLQIRHAQATAKSRYLYWAYLRRNYGGGGQSPSTTKELLAREGCSSSATIFSSKTPWLWGEGIQSSPPPVSIAEFFPPHHRIMELSSSEMTCANALTMTAADWVYFRYFPSSFIVFYFMKSWEWSSLGFLYKGPAATNKIIMRMMIAIAANDMHRQGYFSTTAEKEEARRRAQYHYELAVQEFRQYLEEHGRSAPNESGKAEREGLGSTAETILCIMFLMISYEWYFGHSVKHFQLHLEGVRCLLKAHPEIFVTRDVTDTMLTTGAKLNNGRSFTSSQLLLWILYMEIACHPRGLTGSLYNTLLESGHSSLHPDYLHQCARIWGRCLWAEDYPDTQILDDMENHRALELFHHTIMIWNKIWQLAIGNNKDPTTTPETLYSEMMSIRSLFSDVFLTAKFSTSLSSHRSLYTMYFAVCCFESQILYHRRIFSRTQNNIDRQAVTNILEMLYKQYSVEPKLLQRMPWVIFMVMIETEDPIHRDWAMERLRELRHLHEGHAYINLVVDEVVERQRVCGPGEMVDLLEILQRQYKRHV